MKDNLNVTVDDRTLKIDAKAGEKKEENSSDGVIAHKSHYSQLLTLPGPVQADKMKVDRKEGMLVSPAGCTASQSDISANCIPLTRPAACAPGAVISSHSSNRRFNSRSNSAAVNSPWGSVCVCSTPSM